MMRLALLLLLLPSVAGAESVVATRTVRAQSILVPADLAVVASDAPGALADPADAIGLEARVTLYAGRPVSAGDVGPPATVERNQIVPLAYLTEGLTILTEGRALARGGIGDVIRVMNLASRTTVSGRIGSDGTIRVGPSP